MNAYQNFGWVEGYDDESSSPCCHMSCPERRSRQNAQCCVLDQQHSQKTPLPLQSLGTNNSSLTFVSKNRSIQQTANSSQLPEQQYLSGLQEENATNITFGSTPLVPAGGPIGPHHGDDLSGHMSTNIDLSGAGQQFPNTGAVPRIQISQVDPYARYPVEVFEQHFPFVQSASPLQPYSTPQMFQDERSPGMSDHSRQLDSVLAAPEPSLDALTETKQANVELVFNPVTGQQHKVVARRKSRRSSTSENQHRNLIRSLGGQCASCKKRKRKVSRTRKFPLRLHFDMRAVQSFSFDL